MLQLKDIQAVMFDLDGTIYYGSQIIDGANQTIAFFRSHDVKVFFATNNSTMTRQGVYEKLVRMGVDCRLNEVLTSGFLATVYAKKEGLHDVHIFGTADLVCEFEQQGITVNQSESAENLFIGYDSDMTYEHLTKAIRVALHAHRVIACNRERIFPGDNGKLLPGCGAMTAPIEWCANRKCDVVIGKPSTMMVDYLCEQFHLKRESLLVVGDTYESDVAMAENASCPSVLIGADENYRGLQIGTIGELAGIFG